MFVNRKSCHLWNWLISGSHQAEVGAGLSLNRKYRLTRSTDFKRVRRLGKSYAHSLIVLLAYPAPGTETHFGVAAGRSVGGAVERNRAKRLIRAALQPSLERVQPGWDVVILARQPIREASFEDVQVALVKLLHRASLLVSVYG